MAREISQQRAADIMEIDQRYDDMLAEFVAKNEVLLCIYVCTSDHINSDFVTDTIDYSAECERGVCK